MNKKHKKHININVKNLKSSDFTRSLAEEAMRASFFNPEFTESIFDDIRKLAANLSAESGYLQSESDKSLRFVLDAFLQSFGDNYKALQMLTENDISSLFAQALKYMKQLIFESTSLFIKIRATRLQAGYNCYDLLIDEKIKQLLSSYDYKYAAHILSDPPDYPLASPMRGLSGIFFIKRYLVNLYTENQFCLHFEPSEISYICKKRSDSSGGVPFNIYTAVYLNALFSDYLKKDHGNLILTAKDISLAENLLSTIGENECTDILRNTSVRLGYGDVQYNSRTLQRLMPNITTAIKEHTLASLLTAE